MEKNEYVVDLADVPPHRRCVVAPNDSTCLLWTNRTYVGLARIFGPDESSLIGAYCPVSLGAGEGRDG